MIEDTCAQIEVRTEPPLSLPIPHRGDGRGECDREMPPPSTMSGREYVKSSHSSDFGFRFRIERIWSKRL